MIFGLGLLVLVSQKMLTKRAITGCFPEFHGVRGLGERFFQSIRTNASGYSTLHTSTGDSLRTPNTDGLTEPESSEGLPEVCVRVDRSRPYNPRAGTHDRGSWLHSHANNRPPNDFNPALPKIKELAGPFRTRGESQSIGQARVPET